jgi:hypothetical protein
VGGCESEITTRFLGSRFQTAAKFTRRHTYYRNFTHTLLVRPYRKSRGSYICVLTTTAQKWTRQILSVVICINFHHNHTNILGSEGTAWCNIVSKAYKNIVHSNQNFITFYKTVTELAVNWLVLLLHYLGRTQTIMTCKNVTYPITPASLEELKVRIRNAVSAELRHSWALGTVMSPPPPPHS